VRVLGIAAVFGFIACSPTPSSSIVEGGAAADADAAGLDTEVAADGRSPLVVGVCRLSAVVFAIGFVIVAVHLISS
jgi:hypothetical protein